MLCSELLQEYRLLFGFAVLTEVVDNAVMLHSCTHDQVLFLVLSDFACSFRHASIMHCF